MLNDWLFVWTTKILQNYSYIRASQNNVGYSLLHQHHHHHRIRSKVINNQNTSNSSNIDEKKNV